jgi:hypothetical protein
MEGFFFFFPILWCCSSGDHPYNDLARFGNKKTWIFLKNILASFYIFGYLLELRTESGYFEKIKGFVSKFGD